MKKSFIPESLFLSSNHLKICLRTQHKHINENQQTHSVQTENNTKLHQYQVQVFHYYKDNKETSMMKDNNKIMIIRYAGYFLIFHLFAVSCTVSSYCFPLSMKNI